MGESMKKRCNVCNRLKELTEFYVNHRGHTLSLTKDRKDKLNYELIPDSDTYRPECKDCNLTMRRVRRQIRGVSI